MYTSIDVFRRRERPAGHWKGSAGRSENVSLRFAKIKILNKWIKLARRFRFFFAAGGGAGSGVNFARELPTGASHDVCGRHTPGADDAAARIGGSLSIRRGPFWYSRGSFFVCAFPCGDRTALFRLR